MLEGCQLRSGEWWGVGTASCWTKRFFAPHETWAPLSATKFFTKGAGVLKLCYFSERNPKCQHYRLTGKMIPFSKKVLQMLAWTVSFKCI